MIKKTILSLKDFNIFLTVRKSYAPNSIRHTLSRVNLLIQWLNNKPFNNENIELFLFELKEKGLKNNSINTYINAINAYSEYLHHKGVIIKFEPITAMKKIRHTLKC